ncbi:MAG: signal transduction histidine kinase/ActR/RegA family two-component response regulator [Pseudohongiellaceae bacterium]|jgi:signal transduction histidine kinase/ActR/RegA family two-component response regulator
MQAIRSYFLFLWNGGLNPKTAGLIELRERRILASAILLLSPTGFIVIFTNTLNNVSGDNMYLIFGLLIVLSGLFIQAYLNSQSIAANIVILAFWMMPTLVMQSYGVQGTTMMWLLPIPAIAMLLTGRTNGMLWAAVCCVTIAIYGVIHETGLLNYNSQSHDYQPAVGITNAIEGVMLIMILTGAALIFRTAQHNTEIEFRKLVARLENEVHSRALAEADAKQSEQSKTAFLSAMSHEIRTPLNGVITATHLMVRAKNDGDRKEFSDIVIESSNTLMELVSDVMDLTAMESGKFKIANDAFDLRQLIQSTVRPFGFQAQEKGILLEVETDPAVPVFILGDRTKAKQIVINLVGNAIKFTSSGSVKVHTSIEHNKLKLVVEDTGIGIPEDAMSKLFEPFVQADVTTRSNFGGSGLGLTIVKKIVNAVNGNIKLESKLGEGTKFTVYFPLLLPESQPSLPPTELNLEITLPALNLLVADDNAVNRMVLGRLLENDNHCVVTVDDGKQALDYVKAHLVDAVLMDIQMPIMNGEEAAAAIRSIEGEQRNVPIIAITANTSSDDVKRLLSSNFNGFLTKPFRHEDLIKTLQSVCNKQNTQ